jgi:hypothetical protein
MDIINSYINTKRKIENSKGDYNAIVEIHFRDIDVHTFSIIDIGSKKTFNTENIYNIKNKKNVILKEIIHDTESEFVIEEQISSDHIEYQKLPNGLKITLSIQRPYHNTDNKIKQIRINNTITDKSMSGFQIYKIIRAVDNSAQEYILKLRIVDINIEIDDLLKTVIEMQEKIEKHIPIRKKIKYILPKLDINTYNIHPANICVRAFRDNFKNGGSLAYKLHAEKVYIVVYCRTVYEVSTTGCEKVLYENVFDTEYLLTVFNAESIRKEYHVFDVVIYLGLDVSNHTLYRRVSYIPHLLYKLNSNICKSIFFVKQHIFFTDFDEFILGHKVLFKNMKPLDCNGVIYTPVGSYFEKNYEWKRNKTVNFSYVHRSLKLIKDGEFKDTGIMFKHRSNLPEQSIVDCLLEIVKPDEVKAIAIAENCDRNLVDSYNTLKNSIKSFNGPDFLDILNGTDVLLFKSYYNDIKKKLLDIGYGRILCIGSANTKVLKRANYNDMFYLDDDCNVRSVNNAKITKLELYFDTISMFHYRNGDISNSLNVININSKTNTIFVAIFVSKRHICNLTGIHKYTLEKYYKIKIVDDLLVINTKSTLDRSERIIDIDNFISVMKNTGFVLNERKRLLDDCFMTDREYILSSLYEYVVMFKE